MCHVCQWKVKTVDLPLRLCILIMQMSRDLGRYKQSGLEGGSKLSYCPSTYFNDTFEVGLETGTDAKKEKKYSCRNCLISRWADVDRKYRLGALYFVIMSRR